MYLFVSNRGRCHFLLFDFLPPSDDEVGLNQKSDPRNWLNTNWTRDFLHFPPIFDDYSMALPTIISEECSQNQKTKIWLTDTLSLLPPHWSCSHWNSGKTKELCQLGLVVPATFFPYFLSTVVLRIFLKRCKFCGKKLGLNLEISLWICRFTQK